MYMKGKIIHKLKRKLCGLLFPSFVKKYQLIEYISANRLRHLRRFIDLYYMHGTRNEIFNKKFNESITLNNLKNSNIIDFAYSPEQIAEYIIDHNALSGNMNINYNPAKICKKDLIRHIAEEMSPRDKEIISLLAHGFTPQELHVILEMKHHNSINLTLHH